MAQYEVWCGSCRVSFPVETKRCIHCGARTVAERPAGPPGGYVAITSGDTDPRWSFASARGSDKPDESFFSAADSSEDQAEEETPQRRGLRAGMSLVWMVLLAAGYIWQNCARPA